MSRHHSHDIAESYLFVSSSVLSNIITFYSSTREFRRLLCFWEDHTSCHGIPYNPSTISASLLQISRCVSQGIRSAFSALILPYDRVFLHIGSSDNLLGHLPPFLNIIPGFAFPLSFLIIIVSRRQRDLLSCMGVSLSALLSLR